MRKHVPLQMVSSTVDSHQRYRVHTQGCNPPESAPTLLPRKGKTTVSESRLKRSQSKAFPISLLLPDWIPDNVDREKNLGEYKPVFISC